jgi:hypothetical protein
MPANANDKQVFDVAKPGKTAASATSRPVIVNHGSLLKDPMMSGEKSTESPKPAETTVAPSESRKVITPPSEETPNAEAQDTSSADKKSAADQAKTEAKTLAENTQQANKDQAAAIVDAVVDQAATKKKGEPTKEEVARLAELEKLVESKTYFVPIKTASQKRHAHWLVISIFLLVVAGAYLAVDAELVDIGIDLPVDLVKN